MAQEFIFSVAITGLEIAREFELRTGTTTIGRQVGNDILLEHDRVSRCHAHD